MVCVTRVLIIVCTMENEIMTLKAEEEHAKYCTVGGWGGKGECKQNQDLSSAAVT